jgi:hypothetical protein
LHIDEWGGRFTVCLEKAKGKPFILTEAIVDFLFWRPSGSVVAVSATVDAPKKGTAYYVIPEGFLDEVGVWQWQARVSTSDGLFYGQKKEFAVYSHLTET